MIIVAGLSSMLLLMSLSSMKVYISSIKKDSSELAFLRMDDALKEEQLRQQIRQEAEKRRKLPVDARSDRIWGLIPGYNGLEVDEEKTFQLAKKAGVLKEESIVTYEVPPKIGLDDLQPREIRKGNPNKPMVSLMINVAWGNEFIPGMLDVLKRENVRATFFFDGSWLAKNLDIAKRIQEDGHEMSNHAYSHKNMSTLSRYHAMQEMIKTQQLLSTGLNVNNTLFAPPSGDFNQETVKQAAELGMRTILWTMDTIDWKNPGKEVILQKVRTRVNAGSLILMHPTKSSSDALEDMIRIIKGKGLALGTVSELLSPQRVPEQGFKNS